MIDLWAAITRRHRQMTSPEPVQRGWHDNCERDKADDADVLAQADRDLPERPVHWTWLHGPSDGDRRAA